MSSNTFNSPARTVVITGAAGGIGRAFALGFAAQGDRVVIADRNLVGSQETAAMVTGAGGAALAIGVDVTDRASTDAMATAAAAWGGSIDVLLNNAAIYATIRRSRFEDIDEAEWDATMAVNLKGVWQVSRAVSPFLSDGSAIVNLASATVLSGSAHWAHYVASKGGVIALSRVMAKELGERGIRVNVIAPGFTLTEASYSLIDDAEHYGVDRGSLKRASQPHDIVGAAIFLAGEQAAFITGQTLVVDGGRQFL